jgi:hypothetical protein
MKKMPQISPNSKEKKFQFAKISNKFKASSQEYKTFFFPTFISSMLPNLVKLFSKRLPF